MGRLAPRGHRARPVRFATWLRVGGTPAQLGTQRPPPPAPAPSLLRGSGSGVPGNAHTHASTVFTLSQLCPQRGPSRAASAGPRAAPRFADVTSVLFKARRSGAATALTERRPPTVQPGFVPATATPVPLPGPGALQSAVLGAPCLHTGQRGSRGVWPLHLASQRGGLSSARDDPWRADAHTGRLLAGAVCVPAVTEGAAEDVRAGLSRDRSSVRPRQCAQVPTSVADTWCHVSAQPCACMRGAPPPFQGSGGHPQ